MFLVEQGQISAFGVFSIYVHFTVTIYDPQYRKTSETYFTFTKEMELNSVFLLNTSVSYLSGIKMLPIWPYGCSTNLVDEEFFIAFLLCAVIEMQAGKQVKDDFTSVLLKPATCKRILSLISKQIC